MDARPAIARRRTLAVVILGLVVLAGLAVHSLLPDTAATDIAGDALYAVAAYLFVVVLMPRWAPLVAAALAAGWCVAVELFQLTGIPMQLGAVFAPAMLVLGTAFDARDLIVYPLAIAAAAVIDALARSRAPQSRKHP